MTMERDILKKGSGVLGSGAEVKYAFIQQYRGRYPVRRMCQVIRVSRSGNFAWLGRRCDLYCHPPGLVISGRITGFICSKDRRLVDCQPK